MALLLIIFTAQTASNVASLFGGMLPGGKVSKEKFRALSVKDSKDTKNQSSDSALPMMPVLARLWCHEVSRTFADRLLTDEGRVIVIWCHFDENQII